MTPADRERFDRLVDRVIEELPPQAREVIELVPVLLEDRASPEVLTEFGLNLADPESHLEICGLHTGLMNTEIDSETLPVVPSQIHLFREAIVEAAGGWEPPFSLLREIRITLLHEIGHQLGLDEDDLADLGYD